MSLPTPQGLLETFDDHRSELRRFLIARTGSEADGDDLLNDLWIKVGSAESGPVSNPRSYLLRMANNLVLDRLREARRRERREERWTTERYAHHSPSIEVSDDAPGADDALIERESLRQLRTAIAQLPPGAQRVLRLHKLDGLSHGEVAERLGISRSAVEKHMAVAMTHLRRMLATEGTPDRRRLDDNQGGPSKDSTGLQS